MPTASSTDSLIELHCIDQMQQVIRPLTPDWATHDAYWDVSTGLVTTMDMLVEGQHFRRDTHTPFDIGWKAIAVNLSDLAATLATPLWVTVALGLPTAVACDSDWVGECYQGMQACLDAYGGAIIGGDTVASPVLTLAVTAVGKVSVPVVGRRTGATPGDWVIATGAFGHSAAGFQCLEALCRASANADTVAGLPEPWAGYVQRHRQPVPQCHAAKVLRDWTILEQETPLGDSPREICMMDASDGLADVVLRLAQLNAVDVVLNAEALPEWLGLVLAADSTPIGWVLPVENSTEARHAWALDTLLYGGEDFELVACIPEPQAGILPEPLCAVGWRHIGVVNTATASRAVGGMVLPDGQRLLLDPEKRYQHFRR